MGYAKTGQDRTGEDGKVEHSLRRCELMRSERVGWRVGLLSDN